MHATPFDFDVITGPSVPREERDPDPREAAAQQPQSGLPPAQPQTR